MGKHKRLEQRNSTVVALRLQGKSMKECASALGISFATVQYICKQYGVAGKLSDRKAKYNPASAPSRKSDTEIKIFISERYPEFEYVSGYAGSEGRVKIRCLICGSELSRSMITIRHKNNIKCPECSRKASDERKQQKKMLSQERIKREFEIKQTEKETRFWSQQFNQAAFKECPICGAFFIGRKKYCSDECARKVLNHRKDKRFENRKRDYSITVKNIYKRDGGICWICGKQCNLDDYVIVKGRNGKDTIVCGNTYPSVDHIIPVCEGGSDSWDNVRLACRYCNSMRYQEAYHAR